MAEPIYPTDSAHYINTGKGFNYDLVFNFLDIVDRAFTENDFSRSLAPVHKKIINPRQATIESADIPALFVWMNGETPSTSSMGTLNNTHKMSVHEEFSLGCQYICSKLDDETGHESVLIVGELIKKQILENHNINNLVRNLDIIQITYEPDIFVIDKRLMPVYTVQYTIVCQASRRQKTSRYT